MSVYGPTYPKINTLWKRDSKNRIVVQDYARPEFEALRNETFLWTEKYDGTNTRFYWNGSFVTIGGRTDNAVWNPRVLDALTEIAQPHVFKELYGNTHVTLYGEAFGAGIQKGAGYSESVLFRPFDLRLGTEDGITQNSPFTGRHKITQISHALGVKPVEILGESTLWNAWKGMERKLFRSTYPGHELEGIVGRPDVPFYVANGTSLSPILVKMKYRDLEDLVK